MSACDGESVQYGVSICMSVPNDVCDKTRDEKTRDDLQWYYFGSHTLHTTSVNHRSRPVPPQGIRVLAYKHVNQIKNAQK